MEAIYDCILDCKSTHWYGDGLYCDGEDDPDGHFDCLELDYDGGDCDTVPADACYMSDGSEGVLACDGETCADPATLGDETCDTFFECGAFSYDSGDCDEPDIGGSCDTAVDYAGAPVDGVIDCSGDCVTASTAEEWATDSFCDGVDEAFGYHLDCEAFGFDAGACD
jgi:hypothetical protein